MGKPLSMDLRCRVVEAIAGGLSTRKAAKRFSIGVSTAGTWARLKQTKGTVEPARQGPPTGSKLAPYEAFILGLIKEQPDIALYEIAERLSVHHGVRTVPSTLWYFLDKRGITFKKNRSRERTGPR